MLQLQQSFQGFGKATEITNNTPLDLALENFEKLSILHWVQSYIYIYIHIYIYFYFLYIINFLLNSRPLSLVLIFTRRRVSSLEIKWIICRPNKAGATLKSQLLKNIFQIMVVLTKVVLICWLMTIFVVVYSKLKRIIN